MLVNYFGAMPTKILQNGQAGMQTAEQGVANAAQQIAREPVARQEYQQAIENTGANPSATNQPATEMTGIQLSDTARELVNLKMNEDAFKANARSIEAAQAMFDSLLSMGREPEQAGGEA